MYRLTENFAGAPEGWTFTERGRTPTQIIARFPDGYYRGIPADICEMVERDDYEERIQEYQRLRERAMRERQRYEEQEIEQPKSIEEIEEKLLKSRPLRFSDVIKPKETPSEFLINFFEIYNRKTQTVYVDNGERQTGTNRRRSLGDIYLITKHYYPEVTLKQVVQFLHNVCGNRDGYRTSYCTTIHKRVYYYSRRMNASVHNTNHRDEYGLKYGDWRRLINGNE